MRIILYIGAFFTFHSANAQIEDLVAIPKTVNETAVQTDSTSYELDITNFKTINGQDIRMFVASNYEYPYEALAEDISGTIVAEFIVEKTGKVHEVQIVKGVCESCDTEAIRVIKRIQLHPIEINQKRERVRFRIPIRLILE